MLVVPARFYTVSFENVSVTLLSGDQDFFYLAPADDKPIVIVSAQVYMVGGTVDMGDAQEEALRIAVIRGHATVGSGGTLFTPIPNNPSDAAAGFTARVNDTVIASVGTPVNLGARGMNNRIGWEYRPVPEERFVTTQAAGVTAVVRLMAALNDDAVMSGDCVVAEIG